MLNKNNLPTGILLGLILPVLSALLFEFIIAGNWIIYKRGLPYFFVAAANLIILRYFARKHHEKTAQGIMLVTFLFIIAVFIFRYKQ